MDKTGAQVMFVLQTLGINEDDVLNIYLTGSRLYGTYKPDSDWDFVMVVVNGCLSSLNVDGDIVDKN